jgi:hypothetical protein
LLWLFLMALGPLFSRVRQCSTRLSARKGTVNTLRFDEVTRATGVSRNRILAGLRELEDPDLRAHLEAGRVRRPGGGRKPLTETQPALPEALDRLVSPVTRGDPMSPLRSSSMSTEKLAAALRAEGFRVSADTVGEMLTAQGYSLQATRKILEGGDHPDRDAQFQHIASEVTRMQADGQR